MNIPAIVDVVIGLVFIYLILSLLASEIQELISTVLQWRAQHLRQSIINLLAGDTITDQNLEAAKRLTKDLYNHPLLNDINQEARGLFATLFRKITWFISWIYQIMTRQKEGVFGNKVSAPSYIPGETFATALIERLGLAKLVEPLIEAKFDRFKNAIVENIDNILDGDHNLPNFSQLEPNLQQIYEQFTNREITLNMAIDKMSLRIERFIHQLKDEEQKKKLTIWKKGFFGRQNELAIVNGGLKPTVEEVASLVNQNSRTYQVYQEKLENYSQQRRKDVVAELLTFLLLLDTSLQIISDRQNLELKTKESILNISTYQRFFHSDSSNSDVMLAIPLSNIYEEVNKILNEQIKVNLKSKNNLEAFKQGFSEEGRKLLGSKLWKLRQKELFCISLLGGLLIVIFLAIFPLSSLFVTTGGGISFIIIMSVIWSLYLWLNQESSPNNSNEKETLSNLVDVFFSPALNMGNSETGFNNPNNNEGAFTQFQNNLQTKIAELKKNPDRLEWELSRLGQSFRQYYRALVINNADIDLYFIPSSVKQSIISLVGRARTKIDRTEDGINQLTKEIEIWFDRSMDRSSGVYKRNAKGISLLIGFGLAVATNSNSIYIANRLAYDEELRQALVQRADKLVSENKNLDDRQLNREISQILDRELKLPIGWNPRVLGRQLGCEFPKNAREDDWDQLFDKCFNQPNFSAIYKEVVAEIKKDNPTIIYQEDFIYKKAHKKYKEKAQQEYEKALMKKKNYFVPTAILVMIITSGKWLVGISFLVGWLVTAVAISMGASFWFDLLNKVVNVRNTGNQPPSSANQTSVNSEKSS